MATRPISTYRLNGIFAAPCGRRCSGKGRRSVAGAHCGGVARTPVRAAPPALGLPRSPAQGNGADKGPLKTKPVMALVGPLREPPDRAMSGHAPQEKASDAEFPSFEHHIEPRCTWPLAAAAVRACSPTLLGCAAARPLTFALAWTNGLGRDRGLCARRPLTRRTPPTGRPHSRAEMLPQRARRGARHGSNQPHRCSGSAASSCVLASAPGVRGRAGCAASGHARVSRGHEPRLRGAVVQDHLASLQFIGAHPGLGPQITPKAHRGTGHRCLACFPAWLVSRSRALAWERVQRHMRTRQLPRVGSLIQGSDSNQCKAQKPGLLVGAPTSRDTHGPWRNGRAPGSQRRGPPPHPSKDSPINPFPEALVQRAPSCVSDAAAAPVELSAVGTGHQAQRRRFSPSLHSVSSCLRPVAAAQGAAVGKMGVRRPGGLCGPCGRSAVRAAVTDSSSSRYCVRVAAWPCRASTPSSLVLLDAARRPAAPSAARSVHHKLGPCVMSRARGGAPRRGCARCWSGALHNTRCCARRCRGCRRSSWCVPSQAPSPAPAARLTRPCAPRRPRSPSSAAMSSSTSCVC